MTLVTKDDSKTLAKFTPAGVVTLAYGDPNKIVQSPIEPELQNVYVYQNNSHIILPASMAGPEGQNTELAKSVMCYGGLYAT